MMSKDFFTVQSLVNTNQALALKVGALVKEIVCSLNQDQLFPVICTPHDFYRIFNQRIKEVKTGNHLHTEDAFKAELEENRVVVYKMVHGDKKRPYWIVNRLQS